MTVSSGRLLKPVVLDEVCRRCKVCRPELACPDMCIITDSEGNVQIDYNYCRGCGICPLMCPFKAIEMVKDAA